MPEIFKWCTIVVGFALLLIGLNVQLVAEYISAVELLASANFWYVGGALILTFPPVIERWRSQTADGRAFAELLITLEIYLVISGMLFFLDDLQWKIPVRIGMSLAVTAFVKHGLKQLREFHWSYLLNPVALIRYHVDTLRGKLGADCALTLGIDWLGIGYAFLEYPFGKVALTIGALFLFLSALRGFQATRSSISLAWSLLNGVYTVYGTIFIALMLSR